MCEQEQKPVQVEIPELFYSEITKEPFNSCLMCNDALIPKQQGYIVEKVIRRYDNYKAHDVLFEYAMCQKCRMSDKFNFSADSMWAISNYLIQHSDIASRLNLSEEVAEGRPFKMEEWAGFCAIKGTEVTALKEYQVMGEFLGDKMIVKTMPMVIGNEALEEMGELLSAQTRDELNRFKDNLSGIPDELRDLFKDSPVFVI